MINKFKILIVSSLVFSINSAEQDVVYNFDKHEALRKIHEKMYQVPEPWYSSNTTLGNMAFLYEDIIKGFKRLESHSNWQFIALKNENIELKNKLNAVEAKLDLLLKMLNEELQPGG